jgi:hypothetical protein
MSHSSGAAVPPERTLQFLKWTRERSKKAPYVTWRGDDAYIGERQIIWQEDQAKVIGRVYKEDMPPAVGYLRFYSYLSKRFIGIKRRTVMDFLVNQQGRQDYR